MPVWMNELACAQKATSSTRVCPWLADSYILWSRHFQSGHCAHVTNFYTVVRSSPSTCHSTGKIQPKYLEVRVPRNIWEVCCNYASGHMLWSAVPACLLLANLTVVYALSRGNAVHVHSSSYCSTLEVYHSLWSLHSRVGQMTALWDWDPFCVGTYMYSQANPHEKINIIIETALICMQTGPHRNGC